MASSLEEVVLSASGGRLSEIASYYDFANLLYYEILPPVVEIPCTLAYWAFFALPVIFFTPEVYIGGGFVLVLWSGCVRWVLYKCISSYRQQFLSVLRTKTDIVDAVLLRVSNTIADNNMRSICVEVQTDYRKKMGMVRDTKAVLQSEHPQLSASSLLLWSHHLRTPPLPCHARLFNAVFMLFVYIPLILLACAAVMVLPFRGCVLVYVTQEEHLANLKMHIFGYIIVHNFEEACQKLDVAAEEERLMQEMFWRKFPDHYKLQDSKVLPKSDDPMWVEHFAWLEACKAETRADLRAVLTYLKNNYRHNRVGSGVAELALAPVAL